MTCCAGARWRSRTSPQEWFETDARARRLWPRAASTGMHGGTALGGHDAPSLLLQAAAEGRETLAGETVLVRGGLGALTGRRSPARRAAAGADDADRTPP